MTNSTNPKVDNYFTNLKKWRPELEALRMIILDCGLTEELKWNVPVYTYHGKNIVGLNGLKEFCSLGFFKGVLLSDPHHILEKPGKLTHAGRYVLFTNVQEITELEPVIKAYVFEAVEVEKAGIKVSPVKPENYLIPAEFQKKIDEFPALKSAYKALTPGRQRGYLFYFGQPKTTKTREARIEKAIPNIFEGKGWDE